MAAHPLISSFLPRASGSSAEVHAGPAAATVAYVALHQVAKLVTMADDETEQTAQTGTGWTG